MIKGAALFIYHFHSIRYFFIESRDSLQLGVAREASTSHGNIVPLGQVLPYSTQRVVVAVTYGLQIMLTEMDRTILTF